MVSDILEYTPPNQLAIDQRKLQPAKVYQSSTEEKEPSIIPTRHHMGLEALLTRGTE